MSALLDCMKSFDIEKSTFPLPKGMLPTWIVALCNVYCKFNKIIKIYYSNFVCLVIILF